MISLEALATDEQIKSEYRKTFLLNLFQKICSKMNKDVSFGNHIKKLFRESHNKVLTTKKIIEQNLKYILSDDDAVLIQTWFNANLKKSPQRKRISLEVKENLCRKQNGLCVICGEELGEDMKKIHVDHIIPWKLVGDELQNNYQALCDTCNECKSARTDFIFKKMIKLL